MKINDRIKNARIALQLTQDQICAKSGIPLSTFGKYERGLMNPGTEAIEGLVRAGINANWLLTAEGPMLLADIPLTNEKISPLDVEVLTHVIEEIEKTLNKRKLVLDAAQKAALIQLIYDYCVETGKNNAGTVERFLKLVG